MLSPQSRHPLLLLVQSNLDIRNLFVSGKQFLILRFLLYWYSGKTLPKTMGNRVLCCFWIHLLLLFLTAEKLNAWKCINTLDLLCSYPWTLTGSNQSCTSALFSYLAKSDTWNLVRKIVHCLIVLLLWTIVFLLYEQEDWKFCQKNSYIGTWLFQKMSYIKTCYVVKNL